MTLYVVDGMNVCFYGRSNGEPDIKTLLVILIELTKQGHDFMCIFDASLRGRFKDKKGLLSSYDKLFKKYNYCFSEVTGGTQADDSILSYAHRMNGVIISNDYYRQEKYTLKHTWLTPERLIKGNRINNLVNISTTHLNIDEMINAPAKEYFNTLFELLDSKKQSQKTESETSIKRNPTQPKTTVATPKSEVTSQPMADDMGAFLSSLTEDSIKPTASRGSRLLAKAKQAIDKYDN